MQKTSPEPLSKNILNIPIYLTNQAQNHDFKNLHLQASPIYLEKPPLSLRGTLDALKYLSQRKSRLSLDTSILRRQHEVTVLFAETLIK